MSVTGQSSRLAHHGVHHLRSKPLKLRVTRLRRKPLSPGREGMRVSSEALAKEDWSFGGLRRIAGATGSCPLGSTEVKVRFSSGLLLLKRFFEVLKEFVLFFPIRSEFPIEIWAGFLQGF